MKINFKSGLIVGTLLACGALIYGYFYTQNIIEKTKNVASIDLTQFDYQNIDGEKVELSDFSNKNILVNFWATWCKPCVEEFPLLSSVQDQVSDDFVFLMVSYESIEKIKSFVEDKPYEFVFLKSNNFLVEGISTVPQSFILNSELEVVHHHSTIFEGSVEDLSMLLRSWIQ
jgi:thiol-disulfide isomerase/thioredoxin